jgi:hypothetical protein
MPSSGATSISTKRIIRRPRTRPRAPAGSGETATGPSGNRLKSRKRPSRRPAQWPSGMSIWTASQTSSSATGTSVISAVTRDLPTISCCRSAVVSKGYPLSAGPCPTRRASPPMSMTLAAGRPTGSPCPDWMTASRCCSNSTTAAAGTASTRWNTGNRSVRPARKLSRSRPSFSGIHAPQGPTLVRQLRGENIAARPVSTAMPSATAVTRHGRNCTPMPSRAQSERTRRPSERTETPSTRPSETSTTMVTSTCS